MKQHVAVVGAGFAGMASAYALDGFGVAVTVLEARARVSGRVWFKKLPNGATVELGCDGRGTGERPPSRQTGDGSIHAIRKV